MSSNSLQSTDVLNFDSLDDWLENDLRQCGILTDDVKTSSSSSTDFPVCPSTPAAVIVAAGQMLASPPTSACTPQMDPIVLDAATPVIKYQPLSPVTPKMELQNIPKPSIDLQPFINALTLLGSIQHNNNNNSNTQENRNSNNKRERSESICMSPQDPQDMIALKRQRNTDAARRSRQRKAMKMETLEKRVQDLESSNDRLRLRAAVAESECANIQAKEKRSRVRILELESQLAEAHKALLRHSQKVSASS